MTDIIYLFLKYMVGIGAATIAVAVLWVFKDYVPDEPDE